jgi:hypothetical protein
VVAQHVGKDTLRLLPVSLASYRKPISGILSEAYQLLVNGLVSCQSMACQWHINAGQWPSNSSFAADQQ